MESNDVNHAASPPANDITISTEDIGIAPRACSHSGNEVATSTTSPHRQHQHVTPLSDDSTGAIGGCALPAADGYDDGATGEEDGRALRREERELAAQVAEFRHCAGSNAAFQEVDTTVVYEGGSFIGVAFKPLPFSKTLRRVARVLLFQVGIAAAVASLWALVFLAYWRACEGITVKATWIVIDVARRMLVGMCYIAMILLVTEGSIAGAFRRLRTSWYFLAPGFVYYLAVSLVHHLEVPPPYRHVFGFVMISFVGFLLPLLLFRQVALTSTMVKRKRLYVLQICVITSVMAFAHVISRLYFMPAAARAAESGTDREKTRIAFSFLIGLWPVIALVTATVRGLQDGPALQTAPAMAYLAVSYVFFPRMVQAKMQNLSSQVLSSLFFALFDLVTDLMIPYGLLIGINVKRVVIRFLASCKARRRGRDQHSHRMSSTITTEDTQATTNDKQPAEPPSHRSIRASMNQSRGSSGSFWSRASLRRSLSTILDLQTQIVQFQYHPTSVRRLSDQVYLYGLVELTSLMLSNLFKTTLSQILSPSVDHLIERLVGLLVMVLVEVSLEGVLFLCSFASSTCLFAGQRRSPALSRCTY
ncbi:unnamed protein product [Vitrella brassicaformis CCMP3155]|uniref:Uncharacterized protein n=1 Tax=Vitrella brassicaformis (strain CCMP3155) TaxID=1169540 RepID=A0A0G4EHQ0_VITBC|nr:unnamed protein product [Vitrella brassicaformis CCMP3155]|eukprot:CEL95429.1 unnamed protein product [Vitrella brassicaformis CCMP3155]